MKTNVRETALEIVPGDIVEMDVDVIAVVAGNELRVSSGSEDAIEPAGAASLEEAPVLAPMEAGDAVLASGGASPAKWVVHVAVTSERAPQTNGDIVARATRRALEVADRAGARSIALPAFVAGAGGLPLYACASIMVGEVRRYLEETRRTGIRRVVLAARGEADKAAFENAVAGLSRFQQ